MRIFVLFILLSSLLLSKNPNVYEALGNVIYDNAPNIEKLQNVGTYSLYKEKIDKYVENVAYTKDLGFKIEAGDATINKRDYLNSLRKLSKENDFFVRAANRDYHASIKEENSELFTALVNSGLIDIQKNKQEIVDYYFAHQEDINASGNIETLLDEDAKLRAQKEAELRRMKTKKEREAEKIKRIRENDKREQEALEKKLQQDLEEKKRKLREDQKKELLKTR